LMHDTPRRERVIQDIQAYIQGAPTPALWGCFGEWRFRIVPEYFWRYREAASVMPSRTPEATLQLPVQCWAASIVWPLLAGSYRCETRLSASSSRSIVSIEPLAIQLPNQNFQARPAEIVLGLRKQHIPQTKLDFLFISLHPPWQIMR
jgi:hypothetical protein